MRFIASACDIDSVELNASLYRFVVVRFVFQSSVFKYDHFQECKIFTDKIFYEDMNAMCVSSTENSFLLCFFRIVYKYYKTKQNKTIPEMKNDLL